MTRYLFDTTLLIDHARGSHGAPALIEHLFGETGELYTCDAVVVEALSKGDDAELEVIEKIVQALEYVSTSPDAARWAGAVRRRRGQTSGRRLADALVAGVADSLGATIVTRNPKDFEAMGVPVLRYGQPPA